MGLQYGLITFGFLCTSMVLFHVGGVRDSLAMRAEFAKENQIDRWHRSQSRLAQRRANKARYWESQANNPYSQGDPRKQTFGIPNEEDKS